MELTINSELLSTSFNTISEFVTTPEIFTIIIASIILFLTRSYLGAKQEKTLLIKSFEITLYLVLGFMIISNLILYVFGIEISSNIKNIFSNNPVFEIEIKNVDEKEKDTKDESNEKKKRVKFSDKNEVYHISGNKFTYKDASPICSLLGGRIANYDDLERAYDGGAEWCEYGWSDGQMAYFPTQKDTWKKLQETDNKHACGRPGINGGYIDNPNIRFGINCYGPKPDKSAREKWLMENSSTVYQNPEDKEFEERKDYWDSKISELIVSPFNQNTWNRI